MPTAMRKACRTQHCPGYGTHNGYCEACYQEREQQRAADRGTASERGYGFRWSQLRLMVLRAQPACVVCGEPATDVDHITPKRLGGEDALDNLQALCHPCHTRKTMRERRGQVG